MSKVGYARVSRPEQDLAAQLDLLRAAGCDRIFEDKASGKLAHRPGLDEALAYLRPGDCLTVTKLDRLGRSVKNLVALGLTLQERGIDLAAVQQGIDSSTPTGKLLFHLLAAISEFERDIIVERTMDGLAAARARGRVGGRPRKLTEEQRDMVRTMFAATGEDGRPRWTAREIAKTFGCSPPVIYRAVRGE